MVKLYTQLLLGCCPEAQFCSNEPPKVSGRAAEVSVLWHSIVVVVAAAAAIQDGPSQRDREKASRSGRVVGGVASHSSCNLYEKGATPAAAAACNSLRTDALSWRSSVGCSNRCEESFERGSFTCLRMTELVARPRKWPGAVFSARASGQELDGRASKLYRCIYTANRLHNLQPGSHLDASPESERLRCDQEQGQAILRRTQSTIV